MFEKPLGLTRSATLVRAVKGELIEHDTNDAAAAVELPEAQV